MKKNHFITLIVCVVAGLLFSLGLSKYLLYRKTARKSRVLPTFFEKIRKFAERLGQQCHLPESALKVFCLFTKM